MIRDIKIRAVLNGFVVEVGCQTVVFNDPDSLAVAVRKYLSDPEGTEKNYLALPNAKHTNGGDLPVATAGIPNRSTQAQHDQAALAYRDNRGGCASDPSERYSGLAGFGGDR